MAPQDDDKKSTEPPPAPTADLTPEQIRGLLSSDFQTSKRPKGKGGSRSSSRRLFWAGAILVAGVLYAVFRFTLAPAKVIVINSSGEDAASVVLISGTQRIDLGSVTNGESRKVDVMPGSRLRVEVRFPSLQTWDDPRPLEPFQSLTVFISTGEKIEILRETPWGPVKRSNP